MAEDEFKGLESGYFDCQPWLDLQASDFQPVKL